MSDWFESSQGHALLDREIERLRELVPSGYYPRVLQVGLPTANFTEHVACRDRFVVADRHRQSALQEGNRIESGNDGRALSRHGTVSKSFALPFAERTHDLVVLPHTLDFCANPHAVLREVNQVLMPEGCVVITGFNQWSLWSGIRLVMQGTRRAPWNGQYYRVGRVQDWLALLGYDLVGAAMMAYAPPLQSEKWRQKFGFIEKAGDRWWPGLGAVYVIVGRKREIVIHPPTARRTPWRRLLPGIAQPAAQRAARVHLKLVKNDH